MNLPKTPPCRKSGTAIHNTTPEMNRVESQSLGLLVSQTLSKNQIPALKTATRVKRPAQKDSYCTAKNKRSKMRLVGREQRAFRGLAQSGDRRSGAPENPRTDLSGRSNKWIGAHRCGSVGCR
jgi:hypothetical protein